LEKAFDLAAEQILAPIEELKAKKGKNAGNKKDKG
jgi:hypothetical protein